ncbi:cobalt-precorrin-6x reductase [compost metagenome]
MLVSKNSGGAATEAKLQVARERGLPVLILARPALPAVEREFASAEDLWRDLQPLLQAQWGDGHSVAQPLMRQT